MALQAINGEAKNVDDKTMTLQYLDALRQLGASPSTKFVLPMELTSLMQQVASTINPNTGRSSGNNGGSER
jgi:hypothetical protein